jgi:hypothetical protein
MAIFARSYFTGTNWQTINAIGASVGGPIYDHVDEDGAWYVFENRALCRTPGMCYWMGTPASADYSVTATITIKSSIGSTGVAGRISTSARTYYTAYFENGSNQLVLAKRVSGSISTLGTSGVNHGTGTHTLTLDMVGTTIRALIGGVQFLSVTDSAITAAGKAGIRAPVTSDTSTGKHLDNFVAEDTSTPAVGRSSVVGLIGL